MLNSYAARPTHSFMPNRFAGVAHVLDLGFVQMRQFVLFALRAEPQFVDVVDDLAEVIAAVNLVF